MILDDNIILCDYCKKECSWNIKQYFPLIDFSWIKTKSSIGEHFCNKECKWEFNKYRQNVTLPALAELDESMNYCQYFTRTNWNEWIYEREGFKYNVNWLWDYKSFEIPNAKLFKAAYIKHFWNFEWFTLHNRYI